MEGEGKGDGRAPTRAKVHDTRVSPNSLGTYLVRKLGDIGRQRAVGSRMCNTIQITWDSHV